MTMYPGYTLRTLAEDDITALFWHLQLLDPDIGKANRGE